MSNELLLQKLESLPVSPGCYIFKDKAGAVLYVGKAKSLRSRVRSYFQDSSSDVRAFIPFLRKQAADLDTIVTLTEKEAAILENSLIKEAKPRFNVKLRDDKEFLSLRLSTEHAWPRLELVRKPKPDNARYFGPYHSATAARRTLHLVEKHFQLRTCSDREIESRKRPCLKYQIKRCPAPCVYDVDPAEYASQVHAVSLFMDGRHDELTRELKARMRTASENLEFEAAAVCRDQLAAVESIRESQRVVSVTDSDQDVLGLYREGDLVELSVMLVRSGRVIDVASFSNRRVEVPDDEVVAAFLRDHYGDGGSGEASIPEEIIVPVLPDGADGVAEWLAERRAALLQGRHKKCELLAPARGPRKALLDMALENARHAFEEKRRAETDIDERLLKVQERLRLPTLPRRVECCDISHLGGQDTVGAVVHLFNGLPDKKRYRTYRVRSVAEGDDYGAMFEVLGRRFRRGKDAAQRDAAQRDAPELTGDPAAGDASAALTPADEVSALTADAEPSASDETAAALEERDGADWQLPDLFVVDGGRGQLGVALAAAHDLGLHDLPICGLAKEKENVLGDKLVDRVYLPGQKNPIPLRPNSPELFLLARARDEAHRFSNRGRKKVGKKRRLGSELDQVPGIGPKTRVALLKTLGSLAALRSASDEAILAVPGVSKKHLSALRAWFARDVSAEPPA
ncbi:MAG TPA: excinuclease ABC subunit UvrC [Polyangiaceae bacterium]|nr:excinuclease ABC subunit UvrC [Polyangiaceae bacterium]